VLVTAQRVDCGAELFVCTRSSDDGGKSSPDDAPFGAQHGSE
jgi:hypothetical protein